MKTENRVLCYTRLPLQDEIYAEKLAYSMHLALQTDTKEYEALNHNSGVLFVKGVELPDRTIRAKSLKNPWIFVQKDGSFGILALRTEADGREDEEAKGTLLYFTSKDLLQYEERTLLVLPKKVSVEDAVCEYREDAGSYLLRWRDRDGKIYGYTMSDLEKVADWKEVKDPEPFLVDPVEVPIEGAVTRNSILVTQEVAERLRCKLITPVHVRTELPEVVKAVSPDDLNKIRATAVYSDGTSAKKRIDWYTDSVDWKKPGRYEVKGRIHQDHYEFPIAFNRADPCAGRWNGKYYFIATNDADGNHSLYIREADSVSQLATAQEVKILDSTMYPHLGNLLWAPEFHIIKDRLYIFHAGTPQDFLDEQSHVMALKEGGNPMIASDWEMPRRVVKKDGSPLLTNGITLDMTLFEVKGTYYVVWSQREFVPLDLGAWLYIAQLDPDRPWQLKNDPVVLSKPEYGWANNHTFVDEGPYALITKDKVFVTFSSAAVDTTYVVGILSADPDADLMDPKSWTKGNYPLLTSRSVEGQYGTGHNAYIRDEEGDVWNFYHGRPGVDAPRSSGIRRVHFDIDGFPVLDMTEEKDLNPDLTQVSLVVEV